MNWLEIVGTAIGLIYLWLEYKASIWLWVASITMPAVYIFVCFNAGLYADFAVNVYYFLASVYGLACWMAKKNGKSGQEEDGLPISRAPRNLRLPLTAISLLLFVTIGLMLKEFTDSTVPWADAFTTALSITAMWMLARKYLEQWLVWLVVDIACCVLYVYKDLVFTGGLYGLYAVVAVAGYMKWKKTMMTRTNIEEK